MTNAEWFLLIGGLLLALGLTSSVLKRSLVTSASIYLVVGLAVGPTGLNLFHFNPLKESALLEALTEGAVLISLFSAGVKMAVPFRFSVWRAPLLLATVSMAVVVAAVAAFAWFFLGLPLGAGVLLGAVLAPTDPVLATDVQSRHPGDRDQLRFTLTSEAGMNDGSAFPFVMLGLGLLGLHDLGGFGVDWLLRDVLWSTVAGVAAGVAAGSTLGRIGWRLRREPYKHELMDDFLGLGLIGVAYGMSEFLNGWGFLAVFFAAVALRQTELRMDETARDQLDACEANEADLVGAGRNCAPLEQAPRVSEGALVFKEHLERLSEVILILLIGGTLFLDSWTWQAVGLALFVFLVARPLSVLVGLIGSGASWRIRLMASWFGVRGIGSLYYLMYAIENGLPEPLAVQLIQLVLIVVSLSIVFHGLSAKPFMERYWQRTH